MDELIGRIFFLLFGLILLISTIYGWKRRRNILKHGVLTDAAIVSIKKDVNLGALGSSWFTKVVYKIDGKPVKTNYTVTTRKPKYIIGEVVQVLYDKENPEQNLPANSSSKNVFFFIVFILSLVIILTAILA
jgi:hypothetical protein